MTFPLGLQGPEGATEIDADEAADLIPDLSLRSELNEFEALNIAQAQVWARRSRLMRSELLTDRALRELHRRMFGRVWRWAGSYRRTEKNIGAAPYLISSRVRGLAGDAAAWLEFGSYPDLEICARFHHRLVAIHPFPNGNGRHARLAADLLAEQLGRKALSWGAGCIEAIGPLRARYLTALRSADAGDIAPLVGFIDS